MFSKAIISLFLLLLLLPFTNKAQDINGLLKEAQQLEASFKDEEALKKYLDIVKLQPNNLNALCKVSELYSLAGKLQAVSAKEKEYYRNAKVYAQKALQVNSNSSEANVMMSIAMGRMALIASGREKINAVKDIKAYAERSIQLDANNFKAYHVLGKWHYEVSELNAAAKWLVKVTYGALPKASLDEALRYYEKSRQLKPGFVLNYLEMAKVYHSKDDDKKAITTLETMLKLSNTTSNDETAKKEGRELIKDWK
jgi:tetratricopeptide (TPR) repeat protein